MWVSSPKLFLHQPCCCETMPRIHIISKPGCCSEDFCQSGCHLNFRCVGVHEHTIKGASQVLRSSVYIVLSVSVFLIPGIFNAQYLLDPLLPSSGLENVMKLFCICR